MQMDDIKEALGIVNNDSPSLGSGLETSLSYTDEDNDEPKDVNEYLEYMRKKREALERAAMLETENVETLEPTETSSIETTDWLDLDKNEEGDMNMDTMRDEMIGGDSSIEEMVVEAMQKDEILLYQQKYLESLEARKRKVDTIISMLQAEKETIESQIQAVK